MWKPSAEHIITQEQKNYHQQRNYEQQINAERDRRLAEGSYLGRVHIGGSEENFNTLSALALEADYRIKSGDETPFEYRDAGNIVHTLSPLEMVDLWRHRLKDVSRIRKACWTIKSLYPLPTDFTNDSFWSLEV